MTGNHDPGNRALQPAEDPACWGAPGLVGAIASGLADEAAARDEAQESLGLDSLAELKLHPLVATALRHTGFGIWPEQRYPADRRESRRNHGRRCDLVLTPGGRPLAGSVGRHGHPRLPFPQGDTCLPPVPLCDAFWLEIKTVAQHAAGGPGTGYGSGLLTESTADVHKISSDPGLVYAALLVISFTSDATTARHDLDVWRLRCLENDMSLFSPATAGFPIGDRLGNSHCSLALFPILPGTA